MGAVEVVSNLMMEAFKRKPDNYHSDLLGFGFMHSAAGLESMAL